MKEFTLENEGISQGKNGGGPQTHTAGFGEAIIKNNDTFNNKIELALRDKQEIVTLIGNPSNIRYSVNEIKIGDIAYLKKKKTDKEFRVKVTNINKGIIVGKVINADFLFEEINIGDSFIFTLNHIFGITEDTNG